MFFLLKNKLTEKRGYGKVFTINCGEHHQGTFITERLKYAMTHDTRVNM